MTEPTSQGSPFWQFSLRTYRLPGVADACLVLQEQAGIDVNLLLFLLWHATQRRSVSRADVEALDARIAPWRTMTVIPLRELRRALKSPPGLVAGPTAEAYRNRIKALELEAERLQQEAMYDLVRGGLLGADAASADAAARANVTAYESVATPFPKAAVATLLAALGGGSADSVPR